MLFLLPLLWIIPHYLGAYGVWISMPIADSASIVVAAVFLTYQLRQMRREENMSMNSGLKGKRR